MINRTQFQLLRSLNGHPIPAEGAPNDVHTLVSYGLAERYEDGGARGATCYRATEHGTQLAIVFAMTPERIDEDVARIEAVAEEDPEHASALERKLHAEVLMYIAFRCVDHQYDNPFARSAKVAKMAERSLKTLKVFFKR